MCVCLCVRVTFRILAPLTGKERRGTTVFPSMHRESPLATAGEGHGGRRTEGATAWETVEEAVSVKRHCYRREWERLFYDCFLATHLHHYICTRESCFRTCDECITTFGERGSGLLDPRTGM